MGEESAILQRDLVGIEEPVEREHASDRVFRAIASAILNRELKPEAPLPPERELSDRFGVSRIVVREAIHRLKEYELVRVRQGSPTMVLDPDLATDMRLLGLEIELMAPTEEGLSAFAERQIYSGAALLELAEQRIETSQIGELDAITEQIARASDQGEEWLKLERAYWILIARAAKNRLYIRETVWYFNLLERQPRFRSRKNVTPALQAAFYGRLNAKIRERRGSAAFYLEMLREYLPNGTP